MISSQYAAHLSDELVLSETKRLADCEHAAAADLVALLAELDARKLYFRAGHRSLFSYCTDELHLSEDATYTRIEVARVSRVFPLVLELIREGSLTLTNARLLAPVLTRDNFEHLLQEARYQRKKAIELVVARLRPRPDVPSVVRKLPAPKPTSPDVSAQPEGAGPPPPEAVPAAYPTLPLPASRPAIVAPLAPERFKVQFTADTETHELLRRAQALARHKLPSGDVGEILKLALRLLVADLERTRGGIVSRPRLSKPARAGSRYIPRDVRRAVWKRDDARCAFEDAHGRCPEKDFLEFHHLRPFAHGGLATTDNLELRCRAHNIFEHQSMLE